MATYTVQLHSLSGSFASPWGDDVKHATSRAHVRELVEDWADEHPRIGADRVDAHALVWKGRLDDVTDAYPDWELTVGPRGGMHWQCC